MGTTIGAGKSEHINLSFDMEKSKVERVTKWQLAIMIMYTDTMNQEDYVTFEFE